MKQYIGDSVYARLDDLGRVVLTTENGLPNDPSNTIILEPEVMIALARFYEEATHAIIVCGKAIAVKNIISKMADDYHERHGLPDPEDA